MTPVFKISLYSLLALGAAGTSFFALKPALVEELPPASLITEAENVPTDIVLQEEQAVLDQLDKEASKCDSQAPVKVEPKPAPVVKVKPKAEPKPTTTPKKESTPKPKKTTTKKKTTTAAKPSAQPAAAAVPTVTVVQPVYQMTPYGVQVVPVQRVIPVQQVVPVRQVVPVQRVVPVVPVRQVVYPQVVPVQPYYNRAPVYYHGGVRR